MPVHRISASKSRPPDGSTANCRRSPHALSRVHFYLQSPREILKLRLNWAPKLITVGKPGGDAKRGGFAMKRVYISLGRVSYLIALSLFAAALFIPKADAQLIGPLPQNIVSLTGAAAPAASIDLVPVGGSSSSPYVVPPNKSFILTDIIFSPQSVPAPGVYTWQVDPTCSFFTTAVTVTSTDANPSSFQVHLNTGMVFRAGCRVNFTLLFGSASVNVSAFGFTFP
jgi:hypothetical protein